MKTRLLKKLRAEAKRKYYVKYCFSENSVYNYFIWRAKINGFNSCISAYRTFNEAKIACDKYRRGYILDRVKEMQGLTTHRSMDNNIVY